MELKEIRDDKKGAVEKEEMTAEEIVNILGEKPTILYVVLMTTLVAFNTVCACVAFFPNFGGFINYSDWTCITTSEKCLNLMKNLVSENHDTDNNVWNQTTLCKNNLTYKDDWIWTPGDRTSYAMDWGLWCERDSIRTLISSMYFFGAFFGTTVGGILYDVIGRRRGALVGYAVLIVATCIAATPTNEYVFIICRVFQGVGVFTGFPGMFVLALEFTSAKYRNFINSYILVFWAVGYLLVDGAGYLIINWNWLGVFVTCLICLSIIPLIMMAESPRYYLVCKNDPEAAMESLRFLKKLNKSNFDLDSIILKVDEGEEKSEEEVDKMTVRDTFKDFVKYRELSIQLVFQMFMWCVSGFLYYGFSFSWDKLSDDIYISYLFAATGEVIAYCTMTIPLEKIGRKYTMLGLFAGAGVSFLIAMIPISGKLGTFTLEQISCLFGSMCAAAAFGSIYLYTTELSPTSHRGKMLGICSFSARIGSFAGPYASLLFTYSKSFTFVLFAVLSLVAALFNLRLPETKGIPTPNSAEEVQRRSESGGKQQIAPVTENPAASI